MADKEVNADLHKPPFFTNSKIGELRGGGGGERDERVPFSSTSHSLPHPSLSPKQTSNMPSKEGWLRTSKYLKTRRPAPRVLLIAISNPPYNLLNGDVLYELKKVLSTLDIRETGAVILASNLEDIFISHYDCEEILRLGRLVPTDYVFPPHVVRGALWVESWLSIFGARYWVRRSPLAGLSNLNTYHEVTSMLRSIPQITIAAIVSFYHLSTIECI